MKKICLILAAIFLMISNLVYAAPEEKQGDLRPTVAVIFVNNAKTKFDKRIDEDVTEFFAKNLTPDKYNVVDSKPYVEKLQEQGIEDLTTAERSDFAQAFNGSNVDYVVYLEIQPFARKERVNFFSYGIEQTAQMPFKIIDLVNDKYLYSGKIIAKGSKKTIIGGLKNRGVVLDGLDTAEKRMEVILKDRLPEVKPLH